MTFAQRAGSTLSALLLVTACSDAPDQASESAPEALVEQATPITAESASVLGVRNARMPTPRLITSAQPTPEQLAGLAEAGVEHFISLRPSDEEGAGWEEEAAAGSGWQFARLPIAGAGDLTLENVDALAAILASTGDEPTVLYCASSNRVGALLALKAFWRDGASPEDAYNLGLGAGMTRLGAPVRELLGLAPEG